MMSIMSAGMKAAGQMEQQNRINDEKDAAYNRAEVRRKVSFMQALSVYGAKVVKYKQDIVESALALNKGYVQAATSLKSIRNKFMQDNVEDIGKWLQKHGKLAARGTVGVSANRLENFNFAGMKRNAARRNWAMGQNHDKYKENIDTLRLKAKSHERGLYANIAVTPMPGLETPKPVYVDNSMSIMAGLVGGIFKGMAGMGGGGGSNPGSFSDGGGGFDTTDQGWDYGSDFNLDMGDGVWNDFGSFNIDGFDMEYDWGY